MLARVPWETSDFLTKLAKWGHFFLQIPPDKIPPKSDKIWEFWTKKATSFGQFRQKNTCFPRTKCEIWERGWAERLLPGRDCPSSVNPWFLNVYHKAIKLLEKVNMRNTDNFLLRNKRSWVQSPYFWCLFVFDGCLKNLPRIIALLCLTSNIMPSNLSFICCFHALQVLFQHHPACWSHYFLMSA